VKTQALIATVALSLVIGQVVTFLGGLANTTGWDVARLPCECAWAVLAFPLGWLGLITGAFANRWLLAYASIFVWIGMGLNGGLWAWIVYLALRSARGQGLYRGFDASLVSSQIKEVRRSHVTASHARCESIHARKGLVAIASRAVRRCGYFFDRKPAEESDEREMHKMSRNNAMPQ
jgi:hypothetical protein